MSDKNKSETERLRAMLTSAQMIGIGLTQLLGLSYDRSDKLYDVTLRALVGLTQGACATCGAEPGTNIDCSGCQWVVDAQAALGNISLEQASGLLKSTTCYD